MRPNVPHAIRHDSIQWWCVCACNARCVRFSVSCADTRRFILFLFAVSPFLHFFSSSSFSCLPACLHACPVAIAVIVIHHFNCSDMWSLVSGKDSVVHWRSMKRMRNKNCTGLRCHHRRRRRCASISNQVKNGKQKIRNVHHQSVLEFWMRTSCISYRIVCGRRWSCSTGRTNCWR